jgi:hypothetical protein
VSTSEPSETPASGSLARRIRVEIVDLDTVVRRALTAWPQAQIPPYQAAHLDSVALNLHGFYSGIQRMLELIARHVDRTAPSGEMWHRDLLDQMTREVPGTRPAAVSVARGAQSGR